MDTTQQNSNAWDKKVEEGSRYTQPVSSEVILKKVNQVNGKSQSPQKNQFLEIGFQSH
ncbi:hypothetical protein IG3_02491 [Bacillus cereus HuA2-1]|uniref:Uncharacterized protein n=1 Tax=Bacillus cereus HuA2-1 TaxID=1053201 RepID=J9CGH7_BACCE|nr:hypothetical protein IG3_02491 [Bacillus cereus HuA2-1]